MKNGEKDEGLKGNEDGIDEEIAAYRKEARKGFWKKLAGFFVDLFNAWW